MAEFPIPIQGFSAGFPVDKSPPTTSGYMNNCRAIDVLEKRIRLGQRPGLDKVYSQQIASDSVPIVAICSVSTVT